MKVMILLGVVCGLLLVYTPARAQAQKFAWNEDAPTLAEAQSYVDKYYLDGATTGIALTGVTCSGATTPFACMVNIPTLTNGSHAVALTASNPYALLVCPTATTLVDAAGATWACGVAGGPAGNYTFMRNGVATAGFGKKLLLLNRNVYLQGDDVAETWYLWNGTSAVFYANTMPVEVYESDPSSPAVTFTYGTHPKPKSPTNVSVQ